MKNKVLLSILIVAALMMHVPVWAQLVNCEVFLKGNHLELGINTNGAFGSSAEAPTGYHANVSDTMYDDCAPYFSPEVFQQLGFVADPNNTGWTSFYGDYIMPGNPKEGWAIADDSGTATAYSYNYYTGTSGFTGPLTGSSVSYAATGAILSGTWAGTYHGTLNVNQVTKIDTGKLYLLVHVGFYNTDTARDSFYYMRTVNPHNEEMRTGGWSNKNKVEHQLPNADGLVVVSATGLSDTLAYMALGTRDPRAKCFIARDSALPGPGSLASIWAMDTAHYLYGDTVTGNLAIGLIYKITLGPGDSSFLDFGYSFKGGVIDTALDTSLHSGGGGGGGTLTASHMTTTRYGVELYPNPAMGTVMVNGMEPGSQIVFYNMLGQEVRAYQGAPTQKDAEISLTGMLPGLYEVRITAPSGAVTRRPLMKR